MGTAWRVVGEVYTLPPYDPLDGQGAARAGGRWNSTEVAMTYLSGSLSLAVLEVLVHGGNLKWLADKVAIMLTFDDADVRTVSPAELPANWQQPTAVEGLRAIGDEWVRSADTPVLKVPSAVLPVEFNYLLNPAHPHFARIRGTATPKQKFPLDPRLLQVS